MKTPDIPAFILEGRCRYRNGEAARVLCTDRAMGSDPSRPIVSLSESGELVTHVSSGLKWEDTILDHDLVEIPAEPAKPREWEVAIAPKDLQPAFVDGDFPQKPNMGDPRPPETKWRYFASHSNRGYRWRTDGHRVEATHVEDEGWAPYKSYGPSYFLTPNSGPTYETDEHGQALVESKPLPPGIPQPPEGFEVFGWGPLKRLAIDKNQDDVAGLSHGDSQWVVGDLKGCSPGNYYALRIGSEIHRLNTQPS